MVKEVVRKLMRLVSIPLLLYLNKKNKDKSDDSLEMRISCSKVGYVFEILSRIGLYSISSEDSVTFITNHGMIIRISSKGVNSVEHRRGTTCIQNGSKKYVYVPRKKNDKVLKQYDIALGMEGYILKFIDEELDSVYGITYDGKIKEYALDDFVTNHKKDSFWVLQAPIVALYALSYYARGLRELGIHADYMVSNYNANAYSFLESNPDFILEHFKDDKAYLDGRRVEFFLYALSRYDIFHFHSNCSLLFCGSYWTSNSDLPYVKKMGKKIVQSYWGYCDNRRKEESSGALISECDVCKQLRPFLCENKEYNSRIARSFKYSDVMLTNARAVTQYKVFKWMDNPIDLNRYSFSIDEIPTQYRLKNDGKIKIYHSFGNASKRDDVKGTKYIVDAVEKLKEEGYNVELIYLNSVQHNDIRYYQAQADIVVDQLYAGWYGSTGAECLSLGKIVITYVNPEVANYVENKLSRELPLVSATANTIYDVLKDILDNPKKYEAYKFKARKFAEEYHDYKVVAKELFGIYKELFSEGAGDI